MDPRRGAVLVFLLACQRPATERDVPGRYCTPAPSLPVACITLRAGGAASYEVRRHVNDRAPPETSGHWAHRGEGDSLLVVLDDFPLHPDRGEGGRGVQVLHVEQAANGIRLYADFDLNAYYLKEKEGAGVRESRSATGR